MEAVTITRDELVTLLELKREAVLARMDAIACGTVRDFTRARDAEAALYEAIDALFADETDE